MGMILCPYCDQRAKRQTGVMLFPHRPDLADLIYFVCAPCDAHVGTHKKTGQPMGQLANEHLRQLRAATHRAFDPRWEDIKIGRAHV